MLGSDLILQTASGEYSILAPILLLIVVELSQIARSIDLTDAVEKHHNPLILDAVADPFSILFRIILQSSFAKKIQNKYSEMGYSSEGRVASLWDQLYPRLGSFTIIHTANVSILLLGIYVTRGTASVYGIASGPVIFFLAMLLLPIFEVDEYDRISANSENVHSLFFYIYMNGLFFTIIFIGSENTGQWLTAGVEGIELYAAWFVTISYLYLVALARDVREIPSVGGTGDPKSD